MTKQPRIETRNINSIMKIKLAFFGASKNFYLLEKSLALLGNIPVYQYSNYLSQLAFCVELGLKSIIINAGDFECVHDISDLYSKTPEAFQVKYMSRFNDKALFTSCMEKTKNMFEIFRYFDSDMPKEYFQEKVINSDQSINFRESITLPEVEFLQIMLEEIIVYEKYVRDEAVKANQMLDASDIDATIQNFTEEIKRVQSNIIAIDISSKKDGG